MNEIKSILLFILSAGILLVSCVTEKNARYQKEDPRFGDTESMNYEYTNKNIVKDVREAHYLVNVEIEEPSIIHMQFPDMKTIYIDAPVSGSAIVRITTDASGKVQTYTILKRAGLGLDEYVERIMGSIVVKPVMRKGEKGSSVFTARFVFSERR